MASGTPAIAQIWLLIFLLAPCFACTLCTAQSPAGFLSIDCGSSQAKNYTDALGLGWVADGAIWPEIGSWSVAAQVSPPSGNPTGGAMYQTLRYFPPYNYTNSSSAAINASATSNSSTPSSPPSSALINQTKFCYNLPTRSDQYYLIRATFWYGDSTAATLYPTRVQGLISFRMIVDTYMGMQINVSLPQTSPLVEEMYIKPLGGSSSVSVCLSGASDDSDAPFISTLELRPLASTLSPLAMIASTDTALRTLARVDYGAYSDAAPSIIRYPNDTFDREWTTSTAGASDSSSVDLSAATVVVPSTVVDAPPVSVVETSWIASDETLSLNFTSSPAGTAYKYYVGLFFAERRSTLAGFCVFDVDVNGAPLFQNIDVFAAVGSNIAYELPGPNPIGPISDRITITLTLTSGLLNPFIGAAEILQFFDEPMAAPTSSQDVAAIQDIRNTLSSDLSRFTGDPCLPAGYQYPWLKCTDMNVSPTRVVSISLSNSNLAGTLPDSLNNLDQLTQILLDGNALEGNIVNMSNLVNLQVLNLSNNKLSGSIPELFASMPRLTILDLRNNNLSGEIPLSLQQKASSGHLTFKYDGNSYLCLTSNSTCSAAPLTTSSFSSSSSSSTNTSAIIGSVVAAIVVVMAISIAATCFVQKKRAKLAAARAKAMNDANHVVSQVKVFEAANVAHAYRYKEITEMTDNFSTILGRGGFGCVYRGTLSNGTELAVKVLSDASQQGEHEFLNEVTLLSRVHHKKLVRLVGYCTEMKLVLVYEFMSNGSLFDSLFGKAPPTVPTPLTWIQRLRILLDAAEGLAYLHHGCSSLIIHRDVKSSNILMTKDMEGKMSDFGISKLNSGAGNEVATRIIGSLGYMDPDFTATMILSEKVDIYSFGVVLFEVLCGKPPVMKDPNRYKHEVHVLEWARPFYIGGTIEDIVDPHMGSYNIASIWKVAEIGMACTQLDSSKRPTMINVCSGLSEALKTEMSSETISPSITQEDCLPLTAVMAR